MRFVPQPGSAFSQTNQRLQEFESQENLQVAIFAGGCFWCIEAAFHDVAGVAGTISGYTGGTVQHPTYEQVSGGETGHREAVAVFFNPFTISYAELLDIFWLQIDPTDLDGQFSDRGHQYTTAIYYVNAPQQRDAVASKRQLQESGTYQGEIVTSIEPAEAFYPAEDYHQAYAQKEPVHYQQYAEGSGRKAWIRDHQS